MLDLKMEYLPMLLIEEVFQELNCVEAKVVSQDYF